jgi:acyl-homoserine-lactone acylase
VRESDGKWVSIRLMHQPVQSLMQSWLRTKARDYKSYLKTMELRANSTNNTIFADADGDIAYFHGNFIPRRDTSLDWTKPVDGSNPATEWMGLLSVEETPHLLNPKSGWLYNSNNWPWSGAGASSLKKGDYPRYVETGGESARGLHAIRVLENKKDFTVDSLIAAAYDSYLTWFDEPLPALLKAYDETPSDNPLKQELSEPIELLRAWDRRWAVDSVATSLAVFWGEEIQRAPAAQPLLSLQAAVARLQTEFGSWKNIRGQRNGTAPAETASSLWSSSASACAPWL